MRYIIAAAFVAASAQAQAGTVLTKWVSGTFEGPVAKVEGFNTRLGKLVGGYRQVQFKSEYKVQYQAGLPDASFIVVNFETTGLAADGLPQFIHDWTYPRGDTFQSFISEDTFASPLSQIDLPAFIGDELTFTVDISNVFVVNNHRGTNLPFKDASYSGSYLMRYDYEVGSVPEPATWAMMIGGFAMLGAAARRWTSSSVTYA